MVGSKKNPAGVGLRECVSGQENNESFSVSGVRGCGRKWDVVSCAKEHNGGETLALSSIGVPADICGEAHTILVLTL